MCNAIFRFFRFFAFSWFLWLGGVEVDFFSTFSTKTRFQPPPSYSSLESHNCPYSVQWEKPTSRVEEEPSGVINLLMFANYDHFGWMYLQSVKICILTRLVIEKLPKFIWWIYWLFSRGLVCVTPWLLRFGKDCVLEMMGSVWIQRVICLHNKEEINALKIIA